MEDSAAGTIKRTCAVMEGTHPVMDKFFHRDPEPLAPLRVPCCCHTRTGADRRGSALIAQVTCPCPLHGPWRGLRGWEGTVGTFRHGHTRTRLQLCL